MERVPAPDGGGSDPAPPAAPPAPPPEGWTPGIPSVREHLPSLVFGAALPIGVYFAVRSHVQTDAQALVVAGAFSVAWILIQFARQRRVDFVGAIVLLGFAVGVGSSTLLGGNSYVLKIRDAFFTSLFGVACVVTIYTAKRPALFYVGRYLSAGNDRAKVAAYNQLHEFETGRHTFRVLSVVWGIGLVVEGTSRMVLAEALHTGTFLAVTPFITASIVGTLFAFTVAYTRRAQLEAATPRGASAPTRQAHAPPQPEGAADPAGPADSPQVPPP